MNRREFLATQCLMIIGLGTFGSRDSHRWVACTDRLPEVGKLCECLCIGGTVYRAKLAWCGQNSPEWKHGDSILFGITHWRKLQEARISV